MANDTKIGKQTVNAVLYGRDVDNNNELRMAQFAGDALAMHLASSDVALGGSSSPPSGGGTGTKSVTTGGTAEALAATTACVRVHVQARSGNTGSVWVGIGSAPEGDAIELVPLAGWTFETDDLANIFVNADTGNDGTDGVNYVYEAA